MNRGVSPFLVPASDTVELSPWQMDLGPGPVPLPPFLPDWDARTDLHLMRTVRVDLDRVLALAALPAGAELMLVIEWSASTARITGRAYRGHVTGSAPWSLSVKLEGSSLGGTLALITRLVLARDTGTGLEFTARRAGDVLLEETAQTRLQGAAGRLPTYVVDFAETGFDPDARWHLQLPYTLDDPVLSGLCLYLNEDDRELLAAASNAASPTPVQKRILDWLETDLACQLVNAALRSDWREQLGEYRGDGDSIGGALAALLTNLFPNESAASLGALKDTDPGLFHSRVQGAVRRMRSNRDHSLSAPI